LSPFVIRKCMHHKSLESQVPYTHKGVEEVSRLLNETTDQLALPGSGVRPLGWASLLEQGFDDIDPQGLFTGNNPTLLKNNYGKKKYK